MAEDAKQYALDKHKEWQGKIEVITRAPITTPEELAVAYTPGVAEPCLKISENVEDSYTYTRRGNLVAVVTDGTAVLGLGDIGPEAGMPVMEGKCALFKTFADVDAFPAVRPLQGRGRDRAHRGAHRRQLWRHQPRGHLRAALL